MKNMFATLPRLHAAIRKVEQWHPAMEETQVFLVPMHLYYGFMLDPFHGGPTFGGFAGELVLPVIIVIVVRVFAYIAISRTG